MDIDISKIVFGTDGWRGILNTEINISSVKIVAQAFADYLLLPNKMDANKSANISIVIGYDGRKYSYEFAYAFASVLSGNSIKVFLSNKITPTPVVSYFIKSKGLNAGVMITASHNPPNYNGIKFKGYYGGPFLTEETLKVEDLLNKSAIKESSENISITDICLPYLEHIESYFNFSLISKADLNVAIDSMAGAGGDFLSKILNRYGVKNKTIFDTPDEDFCGRLAEPIAKNLLPLSDELKKGNYSIGVATDGDADRLGVLIENGDFLSAQETILMLADYCKNVKNISGNIVKTSSVTNKLTKYFSHICSVEDVQVGFKYICEKMISDDVAFGCEESGGFGFKGHIPERDGIFSSLIFIEMLAYSKLNRLSDYLKLIRNKFGNIFYSRIDYHYSKSDRLNLLPDLSRKELDFGRFKQIDLLPFYSSRNIINGLKFVFEGNTQWLLLRSSETEPMIRIYAEGNSDEEVSELLTLGKKLIEPD